MDRSNRLVAAKTEYYKEIVELNYRRSKDGRKYHNEDSTGNQLEHVLRLRELIREEFSVEMEPPPSY